MAAKLITGALVCVLALPLEACGGRKSQEDAPRPRFIGRVRWLDADRGYGFITGRWRAVFLHHSAVPGEGFGLVTGGECVEFNLVQGQKGPAAENVTRLEECPEGFDDWYAVVERTRAKISCEPETQVEAGPAIADTALAQKVREIIVQELGVERECLRDDAFFMDDLGADSLDAVELVMTFENEFDIDISDEDAEKLRTVGDAITYLRTRIR